MRPLSCAGVRTMRRPKNVIHVSRWGWSVLPVTAAPSTRAPRNVLVFVVLLTTYLQSRLDTPVRFLPTGLPPRSTPAYRQSRPPYCPCFCAPFFSSCSALLMNSLHHSVRMLPQLRRYRLIVWSSAACLLLSTHCMNFSSSWSFALIGGPCCFSAFLPPIAA